MKRTFTKEYILSNRGCYSREEVELLSFINDENITIKTLLDNLSIKDFSWFLVSKCDLTLKQKRQFALHCAKIVLPIYEKIYPEDKRVSDCISATELFINGEISRDELLNKRRAASNAASAAFASYASADAASYAAAAYAASAAAACASYAACASAASAGSYASAAADDYKQSIWEFLETLK